MTPSTDSDLNNFIESIELPIVGFRVGEVGKVLEAIRTGDRVEARIELGFPAASAHERLTRHIEERLQDQTGSGSVAVT